MDTDVGGIFLHLQKVTKFICMDRKLIIVLMAIIALFGAWYVYSEWMTTGEVNFWGQEVVSVETSATFVCPDNGVITADFSEGQVSVTLPDGRVYTLEQTISASGARFSNEGEAVVFWNKGDSARVEENGQITYENCVTTNGEEVVMGENETASPVSSLSPSAYDQVAAKLIGKWRNAQSPNQIFVVEEDRSFQESYLTKTSQFMVPKGTWYLEKAAGGGEIIDSSRPAGALVFVRVSDKGEERRFLIQTMSENQIEFTEPGDGSALTWTRRAETEPEIQ